MSDGAFEFVLEGPPVSVNAKEGTPKARSNYRRWIQTVATAANEAWSGSVPLDIPVAVTISNYFTAPPGDIDNIIKPILDGMNKIVYIDDSLVHQVTSQKIALTGDLAVMELSPLLEDALNRYDEVIHVVVNWSINGE